MRRTFASAAVAAGQGLPTIGKLLGHTQAQITTRYAHLTADPVKTATDQVSLAIFASITGEDPKKAAVKQRLSAGLCFS